jgi:Tfp pilus assembly protein PilN
VLKEWSAVQGLVDRRAFSWTGLFAALEKALPPGVRLVSVSPKDGQGGMELSLAAVGRQVSDPLALFEALQSSPDFERVFLNSWTEGRNGVDISCTVRYAPKAPGRPR